MAPLPAGAAVPAGSYLLAEIHSDHPDHAAWNRRVGVYLRPAADGYDVVGIERESDPPNNIM